ncbi:uncharacterized protein BXZ73DRAFT_101234 [Epithele typhae]|uniref:uncharacterized protein n=1 Tax=Epithele typhae TaxID=378194 RepID=UPI00200839ED|nr:uncharacterized protein BXZ73DRAFT_101234 [Epithele typhae]KAH9932691.1 hypothetical protein BXZ73DRAFT_101234 [Epithele typhae]
MAYTTTPSVHDMPTSLSYADDMNPDRARLRARQHLEHTKRRIAGPMDPSAFIDKFLPPDSECLVDASSRRLSSRGAFSAVPSRAETSAEIYIPLMKALNKSTKHRSRCHGYVFDITATRTVRQDKRGFMKPHICCYTPSNLETVKAADVASRVDLGYAELFIHVSSDPSRDFFNDPSPDVADRSTHEFLSRSSSSYRQTHIDEYFGQHMSYVAEIFARQSRVFIFSIAVHGSVARMFFWDHSACIVSGAFDLRAQADILCEFLWRFSDRGDTGRGHDVSIQRALPEEEEIFRDAIREYAATQLGEEDDLEAEVERHYASGKVYATSILHQGFSACDENTLRYVFSRPIASSTALAHTGMRGYWAVDVATKTVVFLKDTWRELEAESEGDILRRLHNLGVRNIPALSWQGDVSWFAEYPVPRRKFNVNELQTTIGSNFTSPPWRCRVDGVRATLHHRRHYRLVLGTVGRSFGTVRGTKELLHAGLDVFRAMRDTLEKDSRIHRDISAGNIVLVKEPDADVRRGYLIDWELSCALNDEGDAKVIGRAGTWRFMSIRLLNWSEPDEHRHRFQDDMESLLWVMFFGALMWQPHNYSDTTLRDVIYDFFDARIWSPSGNLWSGGFYKDLYLRSRDALPALKFNSESIQEWLDTMMAYRSPPRSGASKFKHKWTDHAFIHQVWTDFLSTHTLETANRVENVPAEVLHTSDLSSRVASDQGKSPPFPASPPRTMSLTLEGALDHGSPNTNSAQLASTSVEVVATCPTTQHADTSAPRRGAKSS